MRLRDAMVSLLGVAFSCSFIGASCAQPMLGAMPGVINDPRSYSLRRSILADALADVCSELRGRSTPFRFHDEDPLVGRFFATSCASRTMPNGDVFLDLGGMGYVWTALSQRLGFEARVQVAYDVDFQLDGSTMYLYFRPRPAAYAPAFVSRYIELAQGGGGMLGMIFAGAAGQSLPDRYGAQVMGLQLQRGFTVIRDANGGLQTGVGVVPPGERPPGAFTSLDPGKPLLANERVEIHANGRDFVGPFKVPEGRKLDVTVAIDGAPAIDAIIVPRGVGDPWLGAYTHAVAPTPTPGPEMVDDVVAYGTLYQRSFPLPPGEYYLVLDNTSSAGRSASPPAERVVVSYALQLE